MEDHVNLKSWLIKTRSLEIVWNWLIPVSYDFQILLIAVGSLASLGLCTSTTSPVFEQTESRKTSVRSPAPASGGASLVNSLQSNQDGSGKPQTGAQTYSRQSTPTVDYNSVSSPHSTVYANLQGTPVSGQPTQPTAHGGTGNYLFAVNSHGSQYHMPTLTPLVTNGWHFIMKLCRKSANAIVFILSLSMNSNRCRVFGFRLGRLKMI